MARWSDERVLMAINLRKQNNSLKDVAFKLGTNTATVKNYLSKYAPEMLGYRKKSGGARKRIISLGHDYAMAVKMPNPTKIPSPVKGAAFPATMNRLMAGR